MKRLFLLFAIAFVAISAMAVTHANTWTTCSWFIDDLRPEENSANFSTITIGNDTLIDGKTYQSKFIKE